MTVLSGSRAALVVAAVCSFLLPGAAAAAELPAARATLERLHLTPFGGGFAVHGVAGATPRPFHVGLLAHYASRPVVGFDAAGDPLRDVVVDRLTFDLVGGFRVDSWLEVGLRLPVILQDGDVAAVAPGLDDSLASFGVGDPEIALRARLLRPEDAGVGVAVIVAGAFPAGGGRSFVGERGSAFTPTLALTRPLGDRVVLGLDLGGTVRRDDDAYDSLGGGDELFASLGGRVDLGGVELLAELLSSTGARKPFEENQVAVEALAGLRAGLGGGFHGTVGGGAGLVDGYGVPEFRVLAGIGWVMGETSARALGRGERGPEPPADMEFPRRTLEEAGLLRTGSGRPAAAGRAAAVGSSAAAGRPAPMSEPPADMEFARRVLEEAGLLDPVPRRVAQTRPAPAPEPAPAVAPSVSSRQPSPAPARTHAPVRREQLSLRFGPGERELSPEARRQLDALVARIGTDAGRLRWRVEGHADSTGPEVLNRHVSRARAEAVSRYLRSRGLPDAWHEGWFGESDPVADNATAEGRARNRRVELVVTVE